MSRDRRKSSRIRIDHEFHATLYSGDTPPELDEFFPVDAHDISRDGIALITDSFEIGDRIMLMLGPPNGKFVLLVAEVVRIAAMRFGAVYRPVTGCEFTERLEQSEIDRYAQESPQSAADSRVENRSQR